MPLPPRRWFQFRLSTWFVLIAILAWAMMEWPWYFGRDGILYPVRIDTDGDGMPIFGMTRRKLNPEILEPLLALAAFVGWKAAWAVYQSRARRKVEQA